MNAKEDDPPRTLLERLPVLKRPCDLDLLLFFAQHRRTLISSEQLARLLGYPIKEIARSRDALIAAGFLTETQNPVSPARMSVFTPGGANSGSLSAVVEWASTREGHLALRAALKRSPAGRTDGLASSSEDDLATDRVNNEGEHSDG